jgi:hypothetical protein
MVKDALNPHVYDPRALCANVTWNNCLRQFSV